ncbi:MAG: hypothetical protein RIR18_2036 [Pseudomonadota bacterium]|jgi:hypothetical protein
MNQSSPLEYLASFAIAFVAGVVTTVAMNWYSGRLKRKFEAIDLTAQPSEA